jgi:hypothetical protein
MQIFTISSEHIEVSMAGDNSPYTLVWNAEFTSTTEIKLEYSSNPSIIGNMNEILSVVFVDTAAFVALNGLSMESYGLLIWI